MFTGLCFAKFSLPGPRIRFSDRALITTYDGQPALVLRVANERNVPLVEVKAELMAIIDAPTAEGVPMKRMTPLSLVRDHAPLFILSWTLIHRIDSDSPLAGLLEEPTAERDFMIYASVGGLDRNIGQSAHAFKGYEPADLHRGGQFADAVEDLPDGTKRLRLDRLDLVVPGEAVDDPPDD
jgi:inward rectifier potassium channel